MFLGGATRSAGGAGDRLSFIDMETGEVAFVISDAPTESTLDAYIKVSDARPALARGHVIALTAWRAGRRAPPFAGAAAVQRQAPRARVRPDVLDQQAHQPRRPSPRALQGVIGG